MTGLFTSPLDKVTAEDAAALIGWSESGQLEFKRELPERDGKPDPWTDGRNFSDYARNKLFREVVAFANTTGGHLILGVEESESTPPTATALRPVNRCQDLAEQLVRSAASVIDPPIPGLQVRGLTLEAGGSGIVIFRVPASPAAPHRAPDREAYTRRNTESKPMSMREIQDLTLASATRAGQLDARFSGGSARFHRNLQLLFDQALAPGAPISDAQSGLKGYRITAIPLTSLALPRLVGVRGLVGMSQVQLKVDGHDWNIAAGSLDMQRAALRGVEYSSNAMGRRALELYQDGAIQFELIMDVQRKIRVSEFMANAVRVALTANNLRQSGGLPDLEYQIETEFAAVPPANILAVQSWNTTWDEVLGTHAPYPATLPRLAFGPRSDLDDLLTQLHTDLVDACGGGGAQPIKINHVEE